MSSRENLEFETSIQSDSAALHTLVADMVTAVPDIHCLRDPTRGGLATTLNELAQQSSVGMILNENKIPVNPSVTAACELLGLDPLYVANEGKLVCICAREHSHTVFLWDVMRLLSVKSQTTPMALYKCRPVLAVAVLWTGFQVSNYPGSVKS